MSTTDIAGTRAAPTPGVHPEGLLLSVHDLDATRVELFGRAAARLPGR
jgi:hypothetical protein